MARPTQQLHMAKDKWATMQVLWSYFRQLYINSRTMLVTEPLYTCQALYASEDNAKNDGIDYRQSMLSQHNSPLGVLRC
jgi:hypothetical protein